MREVRVQGSDAFVIRSVSVLPESIPAGFSVLAGLEDDESLLIVDLGGTTLDVSHVRSKMTGMKWHTEFGHLNRGDMLTSEQHRCSNEKKKF